MMMPATPSIAQLEREAQLLARYVLNADCPPQFAGRYVRGHSVVVAAPNGVEAAVASFGFEHPWSLPMLDAAAAWLPDGTVLRQKVQLMTAVLEAGPEFAAEFLPRPSSRLSTLVQLVGIGAIAVARALAGVLLTHAIRWRGR